MYLGGCQLRQHLAGVAEAAARIRLTGAEDQLIEARQLRVLGDLAHAVAEAREPLGGQARQHLVDHQPSRVDVGPRVHAAVRRHVARRSQARDRQVGGGEQAEIAELQLSA